LEIVLEVAELEGFHSDFLNEINLEFLVKGIWHSHSRWLCVQHKVAQLDAVRRKGVGQREVEGGQEVREVVPQH